MNSIKVSYKVDTILMNSGKIKTSEPRRLLLNLSGASNAAYNNDKEVVFTVPHLLIASTK